MIPGSNLLNKALSVIGRQTVQWYACTGVTANSIGVKVAAFAAPVPIVGSFQPVPRSVFQQLGLELQREYVNYYTSSPIGDVRRGTAPDEFVFAGSRYVCMSNTDWTPVDGWRGSLAVKVLTP